MATMVERRRRTGVASMRADRILGGAAIGMLALVLVAIARGHAHWREAPASVWGHLALVLVTLVLTPVMMIRAKGSDAHRLLGYVWAALMLTIAVQGFFIPPREGGRFSPIWLISAFVLVAVPRLILKARRHEVARHRGAARGLVIGAFLVAGIFTLPFGRILGGWLIQG